MISVHHVGLISSARIEIANVLPLAIRDASNWVWCHNTACSLVCMHTKYVLVPCCIFNAPQQRDETASIHGTARNSAADKLNYRREEVHEADQRVNT